MRKNISWGGSDSPCKGCTDRHFIERDGKEMTCHAECEAYISWSAKDRERKEALHQELKSRDILSEAKKRQIWRNKRYSRRIRAANSSKG